MSGIAGVVYTKKYEDAKDIKRMTDAIAHRGPHGEGFIAISTCTGKVTELSGLLSEKMAPVSEFGVAANIYISNRTLSLLESNELAHQPIANDKKSIWLTFDGEIYNYESLRREMKEYIFSTNSDAEVLLYAYEKWGIDCLNRLNGNWAFVIYDKDRNILFGARDRFGVKPLYYANSSEYFCFNSEIKGMLEKHEIYRKINLRALNAYLRTGKDYFEGETFFNNIYELKPAHYFIYELKNNKFYECRYYKLPFCDSWESFNERKCNEFIEETKSMILKSIDLRLHNNASVGSCLSGGIDSSAIVCSIDKLHKENNRESKQKAITACYTNSIVDESKWAKIVVDYISADWYKVFPKKEELLNDLSDLIFTQDVPFGSTSVYAQYRVMREAKRNNIGIMFDGQGGDELFTGYVPYYHAFYSEAMQNKDNELLETEQKYIINSPFEDNRIKNIMPQNNLLLLAKKYLPVEIKNWLRDFLHKQKLNHVLITGKQYTHYSYNTLNKMLFVYMSHTSLPHLLRYVDRNSMRFSITSRAPFADDINLIEHVFSIPSSYKIHDGWSKYLLREAMVNIIPGEIKKRTDKIGFETPEYEWVKSMKDIIFDDTNPCINKILNIKKLRYDWDIIFSKRDEVNILKIWRYINFILWFNIYKVSI